MYTLITAATTSQAHKLKNQLNQENIILGDYNELPAIMLVNSKLLQLPNPSSVSYAHEMLTLCLDKQIEKVYALKDEEYAILSIARQLFNEYGIELVHSPWSIDHSR
jgi:hypothetical protein